MSNKVAETQLLDFSYLLNSRERAAVTRVKKLHLKKFGYKAVDNANLFVYLADSQEKRICWSGTSGRIPTFRTQSAKMFHVQSKTWMTGRCKLAALGYPVTPRTALAMGVPIIPVTDTKRAAKLAGNSFNFATAAIIQMLALCCYKSL